MDETQKRRLAEALIKRAMDGDIRALAEIYRRVAKKGGNNDPATPLHI